MTVIKNVNEYTYRMSILHILLIILIGKVKLGFRKSLHSLVKQLKHDLKLKINARFMRSKQGILYALKVTHDLRLKINSRFMHSK